jgi:ceramide glucosyltransferase
MPHTLAHAVELATTALTLAGMGYYLAALIAAYVYLAIRRASSPAFAPPVSLLKSLKGLDPGMLDCFRSHCRQDYAGEFELLFGLRSLSDPAAQAVLDLQREFPQIPIRLIECPLTLGSNGKVSTLAQLATHARHPYLLVNDSDITVSPHYLTRVMSRFAPNPAARRPMGLVTALYRGRAHDTLPSTLEALGISTDFHAGVLVARWLEGGLRFGLGSTLAVSREALTAVGGFQAFANFLADDYELGAHIYASGYSVAIAPEVVETSVPAYSWRGFFSHQIRWYRTVRDLRAGGYTGLLFTYGFPWAVLNVLASGLSPLSLWLLALCFFLRLAMAMAVAAQVLADHQALPRLWLLPLRDLVAMGLWIAGLSGNQILWRGERFTLHKGKLTPAA